MSLNTMRPCHCGGQVRPLHADGKGKNAKRQRPKWKVCERGHRLYRKQDATR